MIHLICSLASHIYVAQNQSDRAASVEAQSAEVNKHQVPAQFATRCRCPYLALSEATENDILVAGGSLYTVGEVLQAYHA
jgi:folylpolyglutamate synthase/dihydropteroate synthase